MLPFEFVATATDSPSDSPGGSLRKFDAVVNGMSGTPVIVAFACANAGPAASVRTAHVETRIRVIERSLSTRRAYTSSTRGSTCPTLVIVPRRLLPAGTLVDLVVMDLAFLAPRRHRHAYAS